MSSQWVENGPYSFSPKVEAEAFAHPSVLLSLNSAMATQNESPSSAKVGPQIRSRTTVVCAECKQQKLRCDRHAPCGSCTKRGTVVRCIYLPGAAEKVDLYSVNNRLIEAESTLAHITAGQVPLAFQHAYPPVPVSTSSFHPGLSGVAGGSQHQQYHQHHHHYAAPPPSSQSTHESLLLSERDVKAIWLDDLSLYLSAAGREKGKQRDRSVLLQAHYPHDIGSGVKLEPSPVETDCQRDHHNNHLSFYGTTVIGHDEQGAVGFGGPLDSLPPKLFPRQSCYPTAPPQPSNTAPLPLIPPMSIYYPAPTILLPESTSSRAASPLYPPFSTSPSTSSGAYHLPSPAAPLPPNVSRYPTPHTTATHVTGPQITPALLALLPGVEQCRVLLGKAREVFRVRPIPFTPPSFFTGASPSLPASLASLASASSRGRSGRHRSEPKDGRETFEAHNGEDGHADRNEEEMEGAWRILERRCWVVLGIPFASSPAAPGRARNGDKARSGRKKGKLKESRQLKEDKEEKERSKRAREIYFAGMGGLGQSPDAHHAATPPTREGSRQGHSAIASPTFAGPSGIPSDHVRSNEPEAKHEESLAFFALMCAVLAIGASVTTQDATSTPTLYNTAHGATGPESSKFLYLLSQQAMGVWDTHTSASMTMTKAVAELERVDHLLACLVCVEYLLFAAGDSVRGGDEGDATEARQEREGGRLSTIVGKLVNAARNMGLGQDPPRLRDASTRASSKPKDPTEKEGSLEAGLVKTGRRGRQYDKGADSKWQRDEEEWKRVLWWSVLFYDLFTASALGQQPYQVVHVSTGRSLPSLGAASVSTTAGTKVQAHPQEVFQANADGEIQAQNFGMGTGVDIIEGGGVRLDPYIMVAQSSRGMNPNERVVRGNSVRSAKEYLSARCRLTHLTQRILHALAYHGCCCGYTIDQAFALERELRSWCASLPPDLRSSPAEIDPGGAAQNHTRDVVVVHASELALLADLLVMKLWSPFLRTGDEATPTAIMNPYAAQASLRAAYGILKAAKTLVPVSPVREMAPSTTTESTANAVPTSLAFLSLPKAVWNSVVVCARACMGTSSSELNELLAFDTIGAPSKQARLEAVRTGLDLLAKLAALEGDKAIGRLTESEKQVAEDLYRCFVPSIAAPISQKNSVTQAEGESGGGGHGRKRKHDEVDFEHVGEAMCPTRNADLDGVGPEPDALLSLSNGPVGGSSGDGAMAGFEFTGFNNSVQHLPHHQQPQHQPQTDNNPGQYLLDPNPVDQHQQPPERSANLRYEPVALEHPHATSSSHSTSASPMPPPPTFSSQQQNEEQDKPGLAAVIFQTAVSRRDEQDRERVCRKKDKSKSALDKEKAQTKKPTSYPSLSIRVRVEKDGLPVVRPKPSQSNRGPAGKAPGPLMTSTPRLLASSAATADRLLAYQQQQKQKMGGLDSATGPAADMTDGYRSGSGSLSMGSGPIQIQPQRPTPPQQQTQPELSNYRLVDTDRQQEHEQPHTYRPAPYTPEQTSSQRQHTLYDPPPQSASFDLGPTDYRFDQLSPNPDPSHGPFSHLPSTKVSDSFSSHPSSSLTSPFYSGSSAAGPFPHPSTVNMPGSNSSFAPMSTASSNPVMPMFGNSNTSHHSHSTPPVFGRPGGSSSAEPSGSPTTYFNSPHSFAEGAFVDSPGSAQSLSGHHAHGMSMLEDTNVDTGMHPRMMPRKGLYEEPTFDNPHQRTIATQSQPHPDIQQHQHMRPVSGYDGHHDHDFHTERQLLPAMSIGSPLAGTPLWSPPAASLSHEHQFNHTYPYWNT